MKWIDVNSGRKDDADIEAGPRSLKDGSHRYTKEKILGIFNQVQRPTRRRVLSWNLPSEDFSFGVHYSWSMDSQLLCLQGTLGRSTYHMTVRTGL